MKKYFPSSELIINEDGSVFHLHVKPEWLADKVILVGDPGRVALVASHFENKECEVESREFKTITGTYKGKRIPVETTVIRLSVSGKMISRSISRYPPRCLPRSFTG